MMKWFQQDAKNDSHRALQTQAETLDADTTTQDTTGGRGRIDLIDLIDFDVQIAVTNNLGIQIFEITDIVTEWMANSFDAQLEAIGYSGPYAEFNTVVLLERGDRVLQASAVDETTDTTENGELYKARFKGAALFTRSDDQLQVPVEVVESIQRTTLINDVALLEALQISGATGLGSAVIDVRAFVNAAVVDANANNKGEDNLEIVIIIAIVVAAVAFFFLIFAIVWAWRYEKTNRDAYLVNAKDSKDKTGSDPDSSYSTAKPSPKNVTPVQEVDVGYQNDVSLASLPGTGRYPTESVISDDISSSLSQYYRSGMADHRGFARSNSNNLNDAASISSMESYGYSLDGYAPSLATPQPSDITGAKERAIGLAQDFDDEPEDEVSIPPNDNAPEEEEGSDTERH
jgi:F0F1-type ATP synthase membrane subunit c/vacuolar-type H+-ATPase subunit K